MNRLSYKLSDNHFCLNVCDEVRQICEPLFAHTPITFFGFARHYRDGKITPLLSDPAFLLKMHEVKELSTAAANKQGVCIQPGFYLESQMSGAFISEETFAALRQFAFGQYFYVFETYQNYDDMICFATDPDNKNLDEFYLNNVDLMEQFILYFRDRAESFIAQAFENRIDLPKPDAVLLESNQDGWQNEFLNLIQPKRFYFPTDSGGAYITKKELGVLKELASGFTAKEAAKRLVLSPRTVESYFNNIKHKLGCDRKSQVLDLFLASKLARKNAGVF